MEKHIMKPCSWIMIFVLLFQWSGVAAAAAAQREAEARQEQIDQAVEKLERLFDALEEVAKEIPRDTFDPQAIVDKVGKDPIALFEWVRDNTYLVPYRGTLRGPIGVLMDRLGNSLDRALLLHELLTIAGHQARLARGRLLDEQAEKVLNEARPIPQGGALPPQKTSGESMDELITKYAEKYGLDRAELQRVAQEMTLQQQHMAEEVAQRVEDQTKAILELVGEPEIDIRAAERAKAIKALQDHWWVQLKGASDWIELDPTSPEAKAGEILVEAEVTLQADNIDEDLQHLVTIRVTIERLEDGKLAEEPVLEHTLRPSNLFGKPIVLTHVPLNWPKDLDLFAEEKPLERLKAVVLEENEWLPVLNVGTEQIWESSFTDEGEVKDEPGKKPESPAEELGRGVRGPFGGMLGALSGGEPEREVRKESHLTAEWIEYAILIPGEQARIIRRQVFNLISPDAGSKVELPAPQLTKERKVDVALALLGETEMLPLVAQLSPEYLQYLTIRSLLSNRSILENLMLTGFADSEALTEQLRNASRAPSNAYIFAIARTKWSRFSSDVYFGHPNILSYRSRLKISENNNWVFRRGFDIVENEMAVHANVKNVFFSLRLEQGVTDTETEAMLVNLPMFMPINGETSESASEVFLKARVNKVELLLFQDKDDPRWAQTNFSKTTLAFIKEDLADSYLVIVPAEAITLGSRDIIAWWRIDPKSGHLLALIEPRHGGADTEYQTLLDLIGFTIVCSSPFVGGAYTWFCLESKAEPYDTVGVVGCLACGLMSDVDFSPTKGMNFWTF